MSTANRLQLGEIFDRPDHLAGVGVFVVIPGNDFHKRGAVAHGHALRLRSVEQRTVGDADDVGRNDFFFGVAEGSGSSRFHRRVDGSRINFAFANRDKLGKGARGNGNALRAAVEDAVKLGDNEADRFRRARGVGDDVDRSGTRAAQIALAVRPVENHLIARVSVDRGHIALLDFRKFVEGVGHGRKAVGGAGSRGDNRIVGFKSLFVYAVNDGGKVVARGSGNDDFLSACFDVRFGFRFGRVEARAFEHDIYFQFAPRAICGVFLRINFDGFAVDGDRTRFVVGGNRIGEGVSALGGIVLQKVRQHFGAGEVVDRDDFVAFGPEHLSESETADTAEAVDRNSYICHNRKSSNDILIMILRHVLLSVVFYHTSGNSSNRFALSEKIYRFLMLRSVFVHSWEGWEDNPRKCNIYLPNIPFPKKAIILSYRESSPANPM